MGMIQQSTVGRWSQPLQRRGKTTQGNELLPNAAFLQPKHAMQRSRGAERMPEQRAPRTCLPLAIPQAICPLDFSIPKFDSELCPTTFCVAHTHSLLQVQRGS